MLESGEAKPLKKEIATIGEIGDSYGSWMVNLTTLAPDIIAAILDDTLLNSAGPKTLFSDNKHRVASNLRKEDCCKIESKCRY
jgi:hypothetical protein